MTYFVCEDDASKEDALESVLVYSDLQMCACTVDVDESDEEDREPDLGSVNEIRDEVVVGLS